MPDPERVFLDANILFSASYRPNHPFLLFWRAPQLEVVTSHYAAAEVRRNAVGADHRRRLEELLHRTELVADAVHAELPRHITLPPKDQPLLLAAIEAECAFFVTGDVRHFGKWMRKPVATGYGSLVLLKPRELLDLLDEEE